MEDDGPNQGKVKQRFEKKREGLNRQTSNWLAGRHTLDRLGG